MFKKPVAINDIIASLCKLERYKNYEGLYSTASDSWFLIGDDLLYELLLLREKFGMADTACGKMIIERYLERYARESVNGFDIVTDVMILTIQGYVIEETAYILGLSFNEVADILKDIEEMDEYKRVTLALCNSDNLYIKDVKDFLLCDGSYDRYRECLEEKVRKYESGDEEVL